MDSPVLSDDEIYQITHYRRPKEQLQALKELGIPARIRKIDNTVCVLRAYIANPTANQMPGVFNQAPKRKSAKQ